MASKFLQYYFFIFTLKKTIEVYKNTIKQPKIRKEALFRGKLKINYMTKQEKSSLIGKLKKQIATLQNSIYFPPPNKKKGSTKEQLSIHLQNIEIMLNQTFLCFLINRIEFDIKKLKNEEILIQARKILANILSKWEKILGREFDAISESKKSIHLHFDNFEIYEHFKKIGFSIDYFDIFYKNEIRWQTSLLTIRNRFLVVFSNALNFKKIIKECDPEYEDYIKNLEICELIKNIFEECMETYWNQNMNTQEFNVTEMNKVLNLIDFLKNFTSLTEDYDAYQRFKKKHIIWKKYIDEKAKEQAAKKVDKT